MISYTLKRAFSVLLNEGENVMYKKFISSIYALNIILQAIFTLLTPSALFFLITWLFVSRLDALMWLYAITVPIGVIIGFVSMIKFVIVSMTNLERLDKQNQSKKKAGRKK